MNRRAFQPIAKRKTLGEEIHEVLRDRVVSGDLSAGDQLPSEKQLADSFQVSRTVIREAISRLRVDGLIQTRQGIGAFVSRPAASGALDARQLDPTTRVSFVFELRWIMEPEATALAARRRTKVQLELVDQRLAELDAALRAGVGGPEADASFHEGIAAAGGNPLFVSLLEFVHQILRQSLTVSHRTVSGVEGGPEKLLREHALIVEAIRARDEAAARAAAREHLLRASGRLSILLR